MNRKVVLIIVFTIAGSAGAGLLLWHLLFPGRPVLRLIYRVDTEAGVRERLRRIAGDLEEQMLGAKYNGELRWWGERELRIIFERPDALPEAERRLRKDYYRELTWRRAGDRTLVMGFTSESEKKTRSLMVRQAIEVSRHRVNALSSRAGLYLDDDRIRVELPALGAEKLAQVRRMLGRAGRLEFRLVDDTSDVLVKAAQMVTPASGVEVHRDYYDGGQPRGIIRYATLASSALAPLQRYVKRWLPEAKLPASRQILYGEERDPQSQKARFNVYYVFGQAAVDSESISDAALVWDERTGRPEVNLTFNAAGARRFEEVTGSHVGWRMAIVLDGMVNSAPVIMAKIGGGRARITMGAFKDPVTMLTEANDLVAVLRAGALPARLELLTEEKLAK